MLCCVAVALLPPPQPRRTNVPSNQIELWCAEPHRTPRLYCQLNPEQRRRLIQDLAFLMLKQVRQRAIPKEPSTPTQTHER